MYRYSHVTCSLHKQNANTGCPLLLVKEISSENFAYYEVVMGGAIRSDSPVHPRAKLDILGASNVIWLCQCKFTV